MNRLRFAHPTEMSTRYGDKIAAALQSFQWCPYMLVSGPESIEPRRITRIFADRFALVGRFFLSG